MSHKKSRGVATFPIFNRHTELKQCEKVWDHNLVTANVGKIRSKNSEGNTMDPNSPMYSYSTTGSDLEGILDLSTKLSGLSSSSSLSWSEDYELEITKKVQFELEKLDKAFHGLGDVPSPNDKEEIAEWKHFFPNLCILDERTPINSTENSEISSESEDETLTITDTVLENTNSFNIGAFPQNKNSLRGRKRTEEQAKNFLNTSRRSQTPSHKPKSLEIEKYLKIYSLKRPEILTKKQNSQPELSIRQASSKELSKDAALEYTSLPFITATPLKTQIRKPHRKNPKLVSLPPIINSFRSISATPRQASSKSMFGSLNFEKNSSANNDQMRLRSDLMKLFDLIPISNR